MKIIIGVYIYLLEVIWFCEYERYDWGLSGFVNMSVMIGG